MPFHPLANTTQVQIRWYSGTNNCMNTFHYLWNNPSPSQAELLALCTEVAGTIAARMRNMMASNTTLREVYARNMHTALADQATYAFPPNTNGLRGAAAVALSEACGLVKRTGLTGRVNHGRNSFSGFAESDTDGNTIGQLILQVLVDVAISVLAQRVGGRFLAAHASPSRAVSVRLAQALALDPHVDSQKTRLNQHGQ